MSKTPFITKVIEHVYEHYRRFTNRMSTFSLVPTRQAYNAFTGLQMAVLAHHDDIIIRCIDNRQLLSVLVLLYLSAALDTVEILLTILPNPRRSYSTAIIHSTCPWCVPRGTVIEKYTEEELFCDLLDHCCVKSE